ncbi:MAG: hypothetical protein JMJ93_01260 [Synergistaceae bacterium]|nr:hypothetical protein [Synergistaceae bacterium]
MRKRRPAAMIVAALALLVLAAGPALAEMTLAVTDFRTVGCPLFLGGAVAEQLRGRLAEEPDWIVVEKGQVAAVAAEHRLSLSGLVDDATAVKVGHYLGARYVIVGSVNAAGGLYTLAARLVDVESGVALLGFETASDTGQEGVLEASRVLADQIIQELSGN